MRDLSSSLHFLTYNTLHGLTRDKLELRICPKCTSQERMNRVRNRDKFDDLRREITKDFQRLTKLPKITKKVTNFKRFVFFYLF